jgi:TniQ
MLDLLPSRPALHAAEALDGYLERLAEANGLSTATLHKLMLKALGADTTALAFLMVRPQPAAIGIVAGFSSVDRAALRAATLMRYGDGLPLHLEGLDPRRRHTYRGLVAQGWFPPHGSQACPMCLARDGIWKLEWRLPIVTVCRIHEVDLLTECVACHRRFRVRRHSPMRPWVGLQQPCGNPTGLQRHCDRPIVAQRARPAAPAAVAAANAVALALAVQRVEMLGRSVDPRMFLAELRHFATMLLHLFAAAGNWATTGWTALIRAETASRTAELRGPRWGISPPKSAALRGCVLAEANAILGQSTLTEAGARLASWLAPIAAVPNGPNNWLINRTTRTATTHKLIAAALSSRHHVGRRLNQTKILQPPAVCAIPQLLDLELFVEYFDGMLGGYQWTGRLYVSLCLARSVTAAQNWSAAAAQLGLDPAIGSRTARAASGRMRATPEAFADSVHRTLSVLPRNRNFRERESRVAALAREHAWFDRWRTSSTPARRPASLPYAITWMWCEPAQGSLGTSPAWTHSITAQAKSGYRAFRDRLAPAAAAGLRSLVFDGMAG